MKAVAAILAMAATGIVALLLWLPSAPPLVPARAPTVVADSGTILQRVRSFRLESVQDRVRVSAVAERPAWWLNVDGERVTVEADALVTAGIDLSHAMFADGVLHVPAPEILAVAVDTTTITSTSELTWLSQTSPETRQAAIAALTPAARAVACERGILRSAAESAATQLQSFVAELGAVVAIHVAAPESCS